MAVVQLSIVFHFQMAIVEYLDETRGPPFLVPQGDPVKRQKVRTPSLTCTPPTEVLLYLCL